MAESQLDRIDDDVADDGRADGAADTLDLDEVAGLHVEYDADRAGQDGDARRSRRGPGQRRVGDDGRRFDDDSDDGGREVEVYDDLATVIDAFDEAFNARDLDRLLELVRDDCETPGLAGGIDGFGDAIADLWDRRPGVLLTRDVVDDSAGEYCIGVLWELASLGTARAAAGERAGWCPIATVHFDDVLDGQIGVVEFSEDSSLLDRVAHDSPDLDLEEGSWWTEWADGADGP